MKTTVIKKIRKNQSDIINYLIKNNNKIIFIKSIPQTGKSTILKKLFDMNHKDIKLFITGCDPKNMPLINDEVIAEIENCLIKNKGKQITIYFDEYYNDETLYYLETKKCKNIKVFITTNRIIKKTAFNYEIIDIYKDIFNGLDKYMLKKYNLNIEDKLSRRKISVTELIKIAGYFDKKPNLNYNINEILNILKEKLNEIERARFLPTTTAILCIHKKFKVFKTFDFEN
ncbi:MAG: hypothetical protein GX641_01135 [Mollicutes bacterium]|nr:hypothetical protein [Mollicutes bacterium]